MIKRRLERLEQDARRDDSRIRAIEIFIGDMRYTAGYEDEYNPLAGRDGIEIIVNEDDDDD